MATNWTAYEAAKALYGTDKELITEVGSRYPLFARTVAIANDNYLLDVLCALPKVTARMVETGLKDCEDVAEETEVKEEVKKTTAKKPVNKKAKEEPEDEEEEDSVDYETMTAKALYALCCKRGISSKCKSRSKSALIEVLKANESGAEDESEDWEDEDEKDPYEGKTAKELYGMCKERGIKCQPKKTAKDYVKLLKKFDEEENEIEEEIEDEEDEWEV